MAQTFSSWECLVVDDGSTDETRGVVAGFSTRDRRIRYVHQGNRGVSAAANRGIQATMGRFLQFLDADDAIEERKLERHVALLESTPTADVAYSDAAYFREADDGSWSEELTGRWMPGISGPGASVLPFLANDNIMAVDCALVRREAVVRVGMFDDQLASHEDWDLWLRLAVAGSGFVFLDEPGTRALVGIHPGSMSQDSLRMLSTRLAVLRKVRPDLPDGEIRVLNEKSTIVTLALLLATSLRAREWRRAGRALSEIAGLGRDGSLSRVLRLLLRGRGKLRMTPAEFVAHLFRGPSSIRPAPYRGVRDQANGSRLDRPPKDG